jgi:hypothetical protein
MGRIFTELVKKHGFGMVMIAIAFYGYRRTVAIDTTNQKLETIRAEAAAAKAAAEKATQGEYTKNIAEASEKAKTSAVIGRHHEAADEQLSADEAYSKNPTEYRKSEVDRAKQKLDNSYEEVKELKESSFFEYFNSFYNNYNDYLDSLTPDKIVCVFNIIIGCLTLSSFISILSIMLSENIINRIKYLDRFPRILKILKIRNNINKQIAKIYLFLHLALIL